MATGLAMDGIACRQWLRAITQIGADDDVVESALHNGLEQPTWLQLSGEDMDECMTDPGAQLSLCRAAYTCEPISQTIIRVICIDGQSKPRGAA